MRYFEYCRKSTEDEDRQVLSIQSQIAEAERAFGSDPQVQKLGTLTETRSAAKPGRAVFNDMLARIEAGEADGIIAWHPNRLARNSIDGGRIIYLLDTGALKDLKFVSYHFLNTPEGKFMLQIMFGQSKYTSDTLSVDVKRGQRRKLDLGWMPNQARIGYENAPGGTIIPDVNRLPLIRKMFELVLERGYSCRQVTRIAREEWGLRTPQKSRMGGKLVGTATVHRILTSSFYAGLIVWKGVAYQGQHPAVVTLSEFEQVQRIIRRPEVAKPQTHRFAYTGMIRCGACGYLVTAEHKVNRHGSRYLYYHCVKRMVGPRCPEPSVEVADLERQVLAFLGRLSLHPQFEPWILRELALDEGVQAAEEQARRRSLSSSIATAEAQIRELTGMRARSMIDDVEFARERERLRLEAAHLRQKLAGPPEDGVLIEPLRELDSFSVWAVDWFSRGSDEDRRLILRTAGSNPTLRGKILGVEAAKPFIEVADLADCLKQRGVRDDVRTLSARQRAQLWKRVVALNAMLKQPEFEHIVPNIRTLRARLERVDLQKAA